MNKIITGLLAIIILGATSLATGCGNEKSANSSTTASSNTADTKTKETAPAPKDDSIKEGMYKVGTDIQPGEYVVTSDTSGYVEVTKDSTGSLDSIVMNENIQGRVYVTIASGQYFTTKNAKTYPADKAPKVTPTDNKLSSGQYKVGVDIQPGEYKVRSSNGGYVEVSKSSKHGMGDIVSNDNFTGDKYITIAAGQYITIRNGDILLK
ncbi:hypothetical protein [Clostridium magnum]|uniref:Lipoprotein n=1 Tax=Clostridium magnum DSM 2767 TaxID=1121326 RepID=A0A162UXF9_9CLOT|nr:hypothetical protein [Clostridium magnum]KZL94384.1 hypothetical protein CLMAG_14370 [Clostridium magnum DSM 2767]SHJ59520.1 hypothetical protein SAMN02745944_06206 [Clostridium magnum DSM 2767]